MHILLVHAELRVSETLKAQMEAAGVRVDTARNTAWALELAGTHSLDLVLIDPRIERGGGWQLIRHLRRMPGLRELPILVLSPETARQIGSVSWPSLKIEPEPA